MTTHWTSDTTWTVPRGSLDSVVTFETFDFPIESESSRRKPPLLLLPPSSSDFEPCEIKLNFTQKHEIRQVYVRSTARVYEIYYAPALQSDNEYLCTVRCSAASVEDSEDDWVEVKLPVGSDQNSNNTRNHQALYEATAEINDSEPCMSLTVRLLSLQPKGCVYVDEVYVFADRIDSSDSENQTVKTEASDGSSLMTMLVPTLLGLTKSRSAQLQDQNSSNPVGNPIKTELATAPTTFNNPVNHVRQKDPIEAKVELTQSQLPVDKGNRAEILLEQLVARVSRIEDICTRFEENMLKPLNSMDARLQRVEQQVELLARCPVSPSLSRPEPKPSSIGNNGNDSQPCGTHKPPEDTSMAPVEEELPCCDEKVEVNDVLESPKKEKPKKTVSIDDALAAALAGFSSFTKPSDSCIVESIDTASGSDTNDEEKASVSSESLKPEFIGEENDEAPSSCAVSTEITDDSFDSHGISQVDDEEAMAPSSSPHETNAQQESIKPVKMLTFDKTDILKHFSDQPGDVPESIVDFDSPILEVKFASFDNGSLKSPFDFLLTNDAANGEGLLIEERFETTNNLLVDLDDDVTRPPTDEDMLIEANDCLLDVNGHIRPDDTDEGVLLEEQSKTANNLLMDLGGDDGGEDVQQDLPSVQLETSFASLI